jgi:alkylation response protein AidB-like acyl-CoA dehydrogenase
MNLTEPQCGTDLGLIRTKAVRTATAATASPARRSGSAPVSTTSPRTSSTWCWPGSKGAPAGVKGISLFVVPKFLVNADGSLGARNGAVCVGPRGEDGHPRATPPSVMAYDDAQGWLVGEEGRGLQAMFVMMNEARLGTGLQGLAIGAAAYQAAVEFAKDRLQGAR